ncbi:MAG TPA: hypothetical protein VG105_01955 [Paraburkholderia sp.]|nr:hypothetical protein [Paraburkholderia sp.]
MKIRTLCIACVTTAAVLLAGCTAVYKNTDACEQMMRSKLADVSSDQLPDAPIDKLTIDHTGTGIGGARVVVEGSLSHMQTASEVAAASAPASAPAAASATRAASAVPATAGMASGAAASSAAASGAAGSVAAASGASATLAAAKPVKPVKPKKVTKAAAVECTFTGLNLASFRWLAPAELVKTSDGAASDTAE